METIDGGPAYPCETEKTIPTPPSNFEPNGGQHTYTKNNPGMSLRDYFAAAALTGIYNTQGYPNSAVAAKEAYLAADAMLIAREEK